MKKTIENALQFANMNYRIIEDKTNRLVYSLGVELENGRFDCIIDSRNQENQVLIYTLSAILIPVNQRLRIAEFVTRANYNLILGNFEMDIRDGEVRFKSSYLFDENCPNSEEIFMKNLFATFHMMDRYIPGIMSVIYANVSPESAINQIENTLNPCLN